MAYWMVLVDVSAEDAQEWMSMDTASKQAVTAVCLIPNVTSSVVAVLVLGRARQHPITPLPLSLHDTAAQTVHRDETVYCCTFTCMLTYSLSLTTFGTTNPSPLETTTPPYTTTEMPWTNLVSADTAAVG